MTSEQMKRVKVGDVLRFTHPDGRPPARILVDAATYWTRSGVVLDGDDKGKRWSVNWDSVSSALAISRLTVVKRANRTTTTAGGE